LVVIGKEAIRLAPEFGYFVLLIVVLNFFLGYLGADFFSGIVHFLGDTFGTETTPVLGASFIKPFREHHVDPKGMTRHDFVETSGNNCIVSLPPMILIYHFLEINQSLVVFGFFIFFSFLMIFVFITNQIHKWAHMEDPGKLIRFLQKNNLILSPDHHQVHHTAPHDSYYCITVGWLNPILFKIKFFEGIKYLTKRTLGRWVVIAN
jgi:hypothetical protein